MQFTNKREMFPHKKIRPLGYLLLTMMLGISVIGCRYPECPYFISNGGNGGSINGLIQIRPPFGLNVYGQLQYLHNSGIVEGGPNRVYIITAHHPDVLFDFPSPNNNENIPGNHNFGITFVPSDPTEFVHVIIESDDPYYLLPRDIQLISAGTMFQIGPRNILYLYNVALVGMPVAPNTNNPMVDVLTEGTLRMKDNSAITGNLGGRGVRVDGGTFYMYNTASITRNTDGGVLVTGSSGTFTMSGGWINVNTATSGGGVLVNGGAKFKIPEDGNGFISNNNATGTNPNEGGGGVHVSGVGTSFTMSGGVIGGVDPGGLNTAVRGGGVMVSGGAEFEMEGGYISHNTATGADNAGGGGVHLTGGGSAFTMSGGWINVNTATSGGGVMVSGGAEFVMEGGFISHNNATGDGANAGGGGVHLTGAGSSFTMNGGIIEWNTSNAGGGGVNLLADTSFTMNNGIISWNFATAGINGGGGVLQTGERSRFVMKDGEISWNDASQGGGVRVFGPGDPVLSPNHAEFRMYNGKIHGNRALEASLLGGGGVSVVGSSRFELRDGTISENFSAFNGGGVMVILPLNNSVLNFSMTGGAIYGNTANTAGGGVWLSAGTRFEISGGFIYGTNSSTLPSNTTISPSLSAALHNGNFTFRLFPLLGGQFTGSTNLTFPPP